MVCKFIRPRRHAIVERLVAMPDEVRYVVLLGNPPIPN